MPDETNPAEQEPEVSTTDQTQETDTEESEGSPETPPVDDTEDVDFEGKRYRLPKELKGALLRQSDYTRKTQETAELKRALDAKEENFAKEREAHQTYLQDHARCIALKEQVSAYEKVDWNAWATTDPVPAQAAWMRYQQTKDSLRDAEGQIRDKEEKRTLEAQRAREKQFEERHTVFAREVPGWSPELANKLDGFARTQGFTPKELSELFDPRYVNILRLAEIGANAEKLQRQAALKPKEEANPVPTVGTGGARSSNRLSDQDDIATWMKKREAQVKRA